jgi:ABC-type antimicrobial peptide transport system permease subunit
MRWIFGAALLCSGAFIMGAQEAEHKPAPKREPGPGTLHSVTIKGNHLYSAQEITKESGLKVGQRITGAIIEQARKTLESTELFTSVPSPTSTATGPRLPPGCDVAIATLTMLFGVLGLVLAAVGLYGVMAYTVEQRTSEIGVRMALGADRASVVRMVLGSAFFQIGVGLGLGIPLAIVAGRLMTRQLFGVSPWDPRMLTIATLLLCAAALLASWLPAGRAASVEPMAALRTE